MSGEELISFCVRSFGEDSNETPEAVIGAVTNGSGNLIDMPTVASYHGYVS